MGFMQDHGGRELAGGDHCFSVTDTGKKAVRELSPQPPRVSRSRARYLRFINGGSGLKFGEWLKRESRMLKCHPFGSSE